MPHPFGIIGVPSSAGAFAPGQEAASSALRKAGLVQRLRAAGWPVHDHGDSAVWRWRPDPERPDAQNLPAVVSQARLTAARVAEAVNAGEIPLVLGGDCTVGIGTVAGVLATGTPPGLLYFDKHADLNTPRSVPEGALDWTGIAHVLGIDGATPELSQIGPRVPLLADDDVIIFGHRPERATAWEREVLARRGLRTMQDIDVARDPEGSAQTALAALTARHDRLLVHLDVDVLDFTETPLSEETGRNEGLTLDQAMRALRVFAASPFFAGLTITELNPAHGAEDGATLDRFVNRLVEALAVPADTSPTRAA